MDSHSAPKLELLNGLRGIAVIAVVLHHSFFDDFRYGIDSPATSLPVALVMSSGWLGVNLFFFLSGFVLYFPYAIGRRQLEGAGDAVDFYRRRFFRLIPLYSLVWVVSLVFVSGLPLDNPKIYLVALGFLTVLFPYHPQTFFPPGNWVMWSIGVEIWFSILFPALLIAIGRFGWRRLLPAVLLFALAVRLTGKSVVGMESEPLNFISDSVFGRLDEFLLGMLAAEMYRTRRTISARWFLAGLGMIIAAALIWAGWFHHVLPATATAFAVNLLDVGILLCVLHLLLEPRRLASWLQANPLQLLGVMCYSIYLWHGIVLQKFSPSYHQGAVQYLAYLAVVFGLSFLTYRYIEFGNVKTWRALVPGLELRSKPDSADSKSVKSDHAPPAS